MKPLSLQKQYNLIKEGKAPKDVFLKEAKRLYPNYIPNHFTFSNTVDILKQKSVISENLWGITTGKKENPEWFKIFSDSINTISEEAKAEEKEPTKEVVDQEVAGYDYKNRDNIDNQNGEEFLTGFYAEMQKPENKDKSVGEIKDIVRKNLEKNELFYVENGQFGLEDVGYTVDVPGLGDTIEPKGKHKSSGYGDLKEQIKKLVKEELQSFPSKTTLASMKDALEGVEDMELSKEDAIKLTIELNPSFKKFETQLRQLADPMFGG